MKCNALKNIFLKLGFFSLFFILANNAGADDYIMPAIPMTSDSISMVMTELSQFLPPGLGQIYDGVDEAGIKCTATIDFSPNQSNEMFSAVNSEQFGQINIGLTSQDILEFHAKRGNSENFIKEEKYGYDLKHFPCQKLKANHAYGLLGLIAANFLRGLEIIKNPNKPSFAKNLRHKLIVIPGKLISHSGKLIMKIPKTHYQERETMITAWRATLMVMSPSSKTCMVIGLI